MRPGLPGHRLSARAGQASDAHQPRAHPADRTPPTAGELARRRGSAYWTFIPAAATGGIPCRRRFLHPRLLPRLGSAAAPGAADGLSRLHLLGANCRSSARSHLHLAGRDQRPAGGLKHRRWTPACTPLPPGPPPQPGGPPAVHAPPCDQGLGRGRPRSHLFGHGVHRRADFWPNGAGGPSAALANSVRTVTQLAPGLQALHRREMPHQDLRPITDDRPAGHGQFHRPGQRPRRRPGRVSGGRPHLAVPGSSSTPPGALLGEGASLRSELCAGRPQPARCFSGHLPYGLGRRLGSAAPPTGAACAAIPLAPSPP